MSISAGEARRKRLQKNLEDVAEEMGYSPMEFTLERMAQDAKLLQGWARDMDRGLLPEGLGHLTPQKAKRLVKKEIQAFCGREKGLAEFFFPKKRATEHSVDPDGPPIFQVVHYSDVKKDPDPE